jgi:hypothetical protein
MGVVAVVVVCHRGSLLWEDSSPAVCFGLRKKCVPAGSVTLQRLSTVFDIWPDLYNECAIKRFAASFTCQKALLANNYIDAMAAGPFAKRVFVSSQRTVA